MIKLKEHWRLLILFLAILTISWPLIMPGYISHHDDLQVMRIFEMRKCFTDGQIPCRWVPDMGYGNGFPLFNYYSAFPYYLGAMFSYILGYIGAAKLLFFIPIIVGGFSMYFLGKELFGKNAGLTAAILYTFAPYRALDLYVRGAIAENFAIALAPWIFYFSLKLIKDNSVKYFLGFSISLSTFLLCHNIMTMLFLPVLLIWVIYFLIVEKFKNWLSLLVSFLLGFGLSVFFILPAYFEQSLIQTDALTRMDLDFRAHFVSLNQLFLDRFWGYGASVLGSNDQLSLQIGWPYWWVVVLAGMLLIINLIKRKTKDVVIVLLLIIIFLLSIFMTHNKSAFIWEQIGILRFTQFPWRFLSLTIFSASLLGGAVIIFFKNKKWQKILAITIVMITIFFNWNYFKPDKFYYLMTDQEKLSGILWEDQQKASILDYLPKTALEPRENAPLEPSIISGKAQINNFVKNSNQWSFNIKIIEEANIEIPVFDFPGWEVQVDNQKIIHNHNNYMGRIGFQLSPGYYYVVGRFTNTPVRLYSNIISITSLFMLIGMVVYRKKIFFLNNSEKRGQSE